MDYNFLDNYSGITTEEIYKMIEEIQKEQTDVIRKTPKEISDIVDSSFRESQSMEFSRLYDLYINPLLELSRMTCNQLGIAYSEIPGFSNLSIMGRFSKLCDFLISKGCNVDSIRQLFNNLPDEINSLLEEKKNSNTPLIRQKPDALLLISDVKERNEKIREFNRLNSLYVVPLAEFSVRICGKLNIPSLEIPNIDNLSIMGRMSKFRDFLISKGCSIDTITKLLPKSTKEIDILTKASNYGFDLGFENIQVITNDNRVQRAKEYLENNKINVEVINNGRKF